MHPNMLFVCLTYLENEENGHKSWTKFPKLDFDDFQSGC